MIPADAQNKIRRVTIYHDYRIRGFKFFDKDGALLWKIGVTTDPICDLETVLLAENEVIVGVVAKLYSRYKTVYTEF